MPPNNEIVLRPRFKLEIDQNKETVLNDFESSKKTSQKFIITRVDNHVFIKLPKNQQHFWSPQLHLEINELEEKKCILRGLFGPKPSVWTMFMFAHLIVICLFTAFGIWAYANFSLHRPYTIQVLIMVLLVLIWGVLYFLGREGKTKGKDEMIALHNFMNTIIKQYPA